MFFFFRLLRKFEYINSITLLLDILIISIFHYLFSISSWEGDDGQDFITVEHCGDDFLAALVESVEDSEDWDDLQAIETEACGTLNDMFDNDVLHGYGSDYGNNSKGFINKYPFEPQKHQNFIQLDSSSDSEDSNFMILDKKGAVAIPSSCPDRSRSAFAQSSSKHASRSVVRVVFCVKEYVHMHCMVNIVHLLHFIFWVTRFPTEQ